MNLSDYPSEIRILFSWGYYLEPELLCWAFNYLKRGHTEIPLPGYYIHSWVFRSYTVFQLSWVIGMHSTVLLSDIVSGISLRMIQLYEQKQNDLSKAQVTVVIRLAKALGCEVEDLIDWSPLMYFRVPSLCDDSVTSLVIWQVAGTVFICHMTSRGCFFRRTLFWKSFFE